MITIEKAIGGYIVDDGNDKKTVLSVDAVCRELLRTLEVSRRNPNQ